MRLCEYDYLEETHLIMGTSSQFCLRWNNHQTNLLRAFDDLLRQESFTDVTLACEDGVTLQAHRLVLAACSAYFSSLFSSTSPSQHPIVILKDVQSIEMRALLQYMYRGEVNIEQNQLKELLRVAEGLRVKGLVEDLDSNTQTQPLPLLTSNSQPLSLLVTPSQRYTPDVTPSPTPLENRPSSNCNEGWESESFYSSNNRKSFHSPPPSPKRSKVDIKEEPHHIISDHVAHELHKHPYLPSYLSQHIHMNHSQRISHPAFDSKESKPLRDSYDGERESAADIPLHSTSNEVRERVSPSNLSTGSTPFSVPGPDSPPIIKRPKHSTEQPVISPNPILRTALAHTRNFQQDVTSLATFANSMMPLPPLLSARTHSIATNEELRRASESHRETYESKYFGHLNKKSDIPSDEDSKSYVDISREEENGEKVGTNGAMLSDYSSYNLDPSNHSHFSNFVSYVPTAKPEWKRYKQYTKADLSQAIDAVRKGMTALQASRKYKVPSRTLYDKIKKMGINTLPRRLPSKKSTTTEFGLDVNDISQLHLQTSNYLDGRTSKGEFNCDRVSSGDLTGKPSLPNVHIQASLTTKESKLEKTDMPEECPSQDEDIMETSTRGSFSFVGTKVYPSDDSGPLDLTDTDNNTLTSRPTIEERA